MEKEALINIILNDINEMHTLVSTFKGKATISPAFIKLAKSKLNNIAEELKLLESFNGNIADGSNESETSLTSASSHDTSENEAMEIAESSSRFASEEANDDIATVQTDKPKTEDVLPTSPVKKTTEPVINEPVVEKVKTQAEPAIKEPETAPKETNKPRKDAVLGEKINTEVQSLNERIAIKKEGTHITQIGKPVDDVRKAIGINDRFYYQRELFDGNTDLFNQTLDQLNQMQSFEAAMQFIQSNYNWENDNEVVQSFLKTIQRRFI